MKNKSLFSRLLENKKLMLIASFLIAFVFWIISSDNISKTIDNVPLKAVLSESAEKENLKVYSVSPETVSIEISGKRLIIDSLTADDFVASVDLFNVSKPGTETYAIDIESKSNMNFAVEGSKPLRVTVMVDREVTKTVEVHKLFDYDAEGYFVVDDMPSTITITGPETIVSKVKSAYVTDTITTKDGSSVKKTLTVHLCDKTDPSDPDKQSIYSEFIKVSNDSFDDVTFSFLKINDSMPLTIKYDQSGFTLPANYYSITPETLSVAGADDVINGENAISSIELDLGSLSKYKNDMNEITFDISQLLGDDLVMTNSNGDVSEVKVQLDLSFLEDEKFLIPSSNIKATGLPEGYYANLPTSLYATVIGTSSVLESLDASDISITYDFASQKPSEDNIVNATVIYKINETGVCWVYQPSQTEEITLYK